MRFLILSATVGSLLAGVPTIMQHHDTASIAPRVVSVPPASWASSDPADSLYRLARQSLTEKEYDTAARLFETIVSKYPRSEYAPDALYWKGFALYRSGNLAAAADALEAQA